MTAFSSSSFNAPEYFQYRPRYPQKLFDVIEAYHKTSSDSFDKAVDLACGCGQGTYPLTARFASVIGVEPSQGMLETARSLKHQDYHKIFNMPAKSEESNPNIEFIRGFAEEIDLGDSSVDVLISTVGANWFAWNDAPSSNVENPIWKEFERVLKPGGSVCLVGYWSWVARDYPLLTSSVYVSVPLTAPTDPRSESSVKIVHSFYDAIPDPPAEKFDSGRTLRLKFDLQKAVECDESIKGYQKRQPDDVPDYIEKILTDGLPSRSQNQQPGQSENLNSKSKSGPIQTPLTKTMTLADFVSSFRTQSRFVKYYEQNPEEKTKIKDRDDLVWRAAKEAQLKQAVIDSKKDGLDLKEGDPGLQKYLWDWEKECEVIYPMVLFFAKKKQ